MLARSASHPCTCSSPSNCAAPTPTPSPSPHPLRAPCTRRSTSRTHKVRSARAESANASKSPPPASSAAGSREPACGTGAMRLAQALLEGVGFGGLSGSPAYGTILVSSAACTGMGRGVVPPPTHFFLPKRIGSSASLYANDGSATSRCVAGREDPGAVTSRMRENNTRPQKTKKIASDFSALAGTKIRTRAFCGADGGLSMSFGAVLQRGPVMPCDG